MTQQPGSTDPHSVGIVAPKMAVFEEPLPLESGRELPGLEICYETYGELNATASNAVLICHALSGHHHAAGFHTADREREPKPGWWDALIGPGKALDTDQFFIVCPTNPGSCFGSTGPTSVNPQTGRLWGSDFPDLVVRDWVRAQTMLTDRLGIDCWAAVGGGSLGGMQALQWALDYPDRLKRAIVIAAAARLSAQNIAFNEVARQAITSDRDFVDGNYAEQNLIPRKGLALARMIGHITYLSDVGMGERFGRRVLVDADGDEHAGFQVESYLHHQGETFSESFDANTYLQLTHMLDSFDPAGERSLTELLRAVRCRILLVAFSSDWRFSPERSREMVNALIAAGCDPSYLEIESGLGHDAFLFPIERYIHALRAFLEAPV